MAETVRRISVMLRNYQCFHASKETQLLTPRFTETLTLKFRFLQNGFWSALSGQWSSGFNRGLELATASQYTSIKF